MSGADALPVLSRISDYPFHYAAADPGRPALLFQDTVLSYGELAQRVEVCARALHASGVRPGERVAVLSTPRPEFFIICLATARLGGIWLGLNPVHTVEEFAYVLRDASPSLVFALPSSGRRDHAEDIRDAARLAGSRAEVLPLADLRVRDPFLDRAAAADPAEVAAVAAGVDSGQPALIVYTSGSTGAPKGALIRHSGLVRLGRVESAQWAVPRLRLICNLPIDHIGGVGDLCCVPLVAGGSIVFQEHFDAQRTRGPAELPVARGRPARGGCVIIGSAMTLTQLNAFVLVARLGSVTAAANALGVSESAVSQALSALRLHLGDQLVTRGPVGMTLTAGGSRLLATASQIVVLGAEAQAAVRAAQGAPEQLRVVSNSTVAEFVISPLTEAFTKRFSGSVEVSAGVAATREMNVLIANRLADVAIGSGPRGLPDDPALALVTEPIFRYRLVVVTAGQPRLRGAPRQWRWFVDSSGTDPDSETGQMLSGLGIPEDQIRVFPNQTAAWAAAAGGTGVAPAVEHLVAQQLRRGELSRVDLPGCRVDACWHVTLLERQHQSPAASSFRRYLGTPEAMHLMRSPAGGVPPSKFRPPVYVTIWS